MSTKRYRKAKPGHWTRTGEKPLHEPVEDDSAHMEENEDEREEWTQHAADWGAATKELLTMPREDFKTDTALSIEDWTGIYASRAGHCGLMALKHEDSRDKS